MPSRYIKAIIGKRDTSSGLLTIIAKSALPLGQHFVDVVVGDKRINLEMTVEGEDSIANPPNVGMVEQKRGLTPATSIGLILKQ